MNSLSSGSLILATWSSKYADAAFCRGPSFRSALMATEHCASRCAGLTPGINGDAFKGAANIAMAIKLTALLC